MYKSSGNLQRKKILKILHRKINLENLSMGTMKNIACYHIFCKKNFLNKLMMLPLRLWNNWPKINPFAHNLKEYGSTVLHFHIKIHMSETCSFYWRQSKSIILSLWKPFRRGFTSPSWIKVLTHFKQCSFSATLEKQVCDGFIGYRGGFTILAGGQGVLRPYSMVAEPRLTAMF